MLKQITIKDLAILDDITLEFEDHFNVLTGETGAGKSIIIDALSLVFGARASIDMIRHGSDMAKIEALLFINKEHADRIYKEFDIDVYDEFIIQRFLYSNGRSVTKINGNLVSLSVLNKISNYLIDIHSQHENQYLLNQHNHLKLLDQYILSKNNDFLVEYSKQYKIYLDLITQKENLFNLIKGNNDIDYLTYQYNELKDVISLDEEEKLHKELKYLQNFEKNAVTIEETLYFLDGNQKAIESLYSAYKTLQKIDDENALSYADRLESSYLEVKDIYESIKTDFDTSNFDETKLNNIKDQITKINRLKRKYNVDDLLNLKDEIKNKLDAINDFNDKQVFLDQKINKQLLLCNSLAEDISKIRHEYAIKLENEIKAHLHDLYLENALFSVVFNKTNELNKNGNEDIEFYLSTNIGEPQKPLAKIASGGEISRIMLGLKAVFSKTTGIDMIIFDEIDTGVSGKVASAMGQKMKEISKYAQVLSVTHLPQVACYSDQHIYISKDTCNDRTTTKVTHLDNQGKIMEIARLLSGDKITANSINMAKDLLLGNH